MKRTEIKQIYKDIASYADKTVTVCGWVRTVRDSKAFGFIELNDGSFFKNILDLSGNWSSLCAHKKIVSETKYSGRCSFYNLII